MEHLASKGSQVPGAIISGLEHVCDDWDEALRNMPTPQITPETFVTIETFRGTVETWKWIIAGICGVTVSTFGLLFAWIYPVIGVKAVLEKHIEDDEKRHAELVVQLGQEHRENQERLVTMRADLAAGQQTMRSELVSGHQVTLLEIHRLGDLLNRYILRDREI